MFSRIFYVSFLILLLPVFCYGSVADTSDALTVKNRYTFKVGISGYKGWDEGETIADFGGYDPGTWYKRHLNIKMEVNYGVSKYWEVGLFVGIQQYAYDDGWNDTLILDNYTLITHNTMSKNTIAPIFGVSVHFHVLPLFIQESKCRWDLYFSAQYGGCVLFRTETNASGEHHYRQEYGTGIGLAYYIKNRAGFFAEFHFGNYSYFPNYVNSYSNFRAGLTFKL